MRTDHLGADPNGFVRGDLDVVTLSADGTHWEHIHPLDGEPFSPAYRLLDDPRIVVSGGRLYVGANDASGPIVVDRLSSDGRGFERLEDPSPIPEYESFIDMADLGGQLGMLTGSALYTLGPDDHWTRTTTPTNFGGFALTYAGGEPYVASGGEPIRVIVLRGGSWQTLPSPGSTGGDITRLRLFTVGDRPWIFFKGRQNGWGNYYFGGDLFLGGTFDPRPPKQPPVEPPPPEPRGDCGRIQTGTSGKDLLSGGPGPDELYGGGAADWLLGRGGADCLYGGAGNDRLSSGSGSDFAFGQRGADRVYGGRGHDVLYGGSGRDRLYPGTGPDDVAAGTGRDVVYAVGGGVDHVDCGPGRDTLHASRNDGSRRCERIVIGR